MEAVGVRQLKENLSRYLKKVRSGERIVVTDRKEEKPFLRPFLKIEGKRWSCISIPGA